MSAVPEHNYSYIATLIFQTSKHLKCPGASVYSSTHIQAYAITMACLGFCAMDHDCI